MSNYMFLTVLLRGCWMYARNFWVYESMSAEQLFAALKNPPQDDYEARQLWSAYCRKAKQLGCLTRIAFACGEEEFPHRICLMAAESILDACKTTSVNHTLLGPCRYGATARDGRSEYVRQVWRQFPELRRMAREVARQFTDREIQSLDIIFVDENKWA